MVAITRFGFFLAISLALVAPVQADDSIRRDKIVSVIQSQLEAFRRDDAVAAYSHAAPQILAMFGSAEKFMQMVMTDYGALYRHKSVTFLDLVYMSVMGGMVQRVLVTGPDGAEAIALYTVEQMDDDVWRITGCMLVPAGGNPT